MIGTGIVRCSIMSYAIQKEKLDHKVLSSLKIQSSVSSCLNVLIHKLYSVIHGFIQYFYQA